MHRDLENTQKVRKLLKLIIKEVTDVDFPQSKFGASLLA